MSNTHDPGLEVQAIMTWWRSLYPDDQTKRRGNAGARAALRRADSPFQALLLPACHDLFRLLRDRGVSPGRLSDAHLKRIAMAAALICECPGTVTGPKSFASAMGNASEGERARLSPLRFQGLMATMDRADGAEQMTALRRALAHVKDAPFNVRGLVRDMLWFSNQTRIDWTFDYYGTRRDAPSAAISENEETPA
ncbi:type I-E CRISPR-associated protein Cse2/CasB [Agrobacterium vitis]|uniref:type I-E CRISPR-associated protein Cse2/CasB n=1 Tax=Agrobacterium vitis TaxID=373 RepID=UPI0012E902E9|nr:type I-E CRISPR-associated protein Cse2/CasB [Agrobacterium vitis]MVA25248.1 type I-E CRISPR-associated protein Cse2/CasB [Agrobacterium vitis]